MGKILDDVGVLVDGKISRSSRQAFVDDVNILLLNGHQGDFVPFSLPSITFFDAVPELQTPFNVQPLERHQEIFKMWHLVWIDTLFQGVANALNVNSARPLMPIADPTSYAVDLGIDLKPNISFNDILPKLLAPLPPPGIFELFQIDITDVDFLAQLAIKLPTLFVPISLPQLPQLPSFSDFSIDTAKLVPPDINIPLNTIKLPGVPEIPLIPPAHLPNLPLQNMLQVIECFVKK